MTESRVSVTGIYHRGGGQSIEKMPKVKLIGRKNVQNRKESGRQGPGRIESSEAQGIRALQVVNNRPGPTALLHLGLPLVHACQVLLGIDVVRAQLGDI